VIASFQNRWRLRGFGGSHAQENSFAGVRIETKTVVSHIRRSKAKVEVARARVAAASVTTLREC